MVYDRLRDFHRKKAWKMSRPASVDSVLETSMKDQEGNLSEKKNVSSKPQPLVDACVFAKVIASSRSNLSEIPHKCSVLGTLGKVCEHHGTKLWPISQMLRQSVFSSESLDYNVLDIFWWQFCLASKWTCRVLLGVLETVCQGSLVEVSTLAP